MAMLKPDDRDYKIRKIGKFVCVAMNSAHLAARGFRINSRISRLLNATTASSGLHRAVIDVAGAVISEKVKYTRRRCVGFFSVYVGNPILRTGPAINHRRCNLPVINRRGKSR